MPTATIIDTATGLMRAVEDPPVVDLRIIEWQDEEDPAAYGHHIQYRTPASDWQDVPVQRVAPRQTPRRLPLEQPAPQPFPSVPPSPDGTILTMPVQVFHDPTTGSLILFVVDKHHAHGIFRASGWVAPHDVATLIARNKELLEAAEECERTNQGLIARLRAAEAANQGLRGDNARALDFATGSTLHHIGRAMALLMLGRSARRAGWPSGAYIRRSSMVGLSDPIIVLHGADGSMQPWHATTDALLATDWCEVASNEAKPAV